MNRIRPTARHACRMRGFSPDAGDVEVTPLQQWAACSVKIEKASSKGAREAPVLTLPYVDCDEELWPIVSCVRFGADQHPRCEGRGVLADHIHSGSAVKSTVSQVCGHEASKRRFPNGCHPPAPAVSTRNRLARGCGPRQIARAPPEPRDSNSARTHVPS